MNPLVILKTNPTKAYTQPAIHESYAPTDPVLPMIRPQQNPTQLKDKDDERHFP